MNEQIFFTIKEAAQFLFPNRKGKGGELALRRLCKDGQIKCLKLGSTSLISRATLLGFGVNSLSTAKTALRVVEAQGILHKANDETGAD
tara:strand:+ start:3651 stop:3917 length:267 start_codon:yes stop_codon:yes gene_type:complete